MRSRRGTQGFILPLAVLLSVVLAISGASFMQLDFLERRLTVKEIDHERAFYLASAGLERGRAAYKIPEDFAWTFVLDGTYDGDADGTPDCPTDSSPPCLSDDPTSCLCPPDLSRGCATPPFQTQARNPKRITTDGEPVAFPDLPFHETFQSGQYSVRAFNNEPDLIDTDQTLILRALGVIRGQQKLLEANVKAVSGLGLVNCEGARGETCLDARDTEIVLEFRDGREPKTHPQNPSFDPHFYSRAEHFPWVQAAYYLPASAELVIEDGTFYFIDGDIHLWNATANQTVLFSTGDVQVTGRSELTDTMLVSLGTIHLEGDVIWRAPLAYGPYPAGIAAEAIKSRAQAEVYGTLHSAGPIDWKAGELHGLLIGSDIIIRRPQATRLTDDGNPQFYDLTPGFSYPTELRTTAMLPGTWREIK